MQNPSNPADGQKVVIQNGQRVTGPLSEQDAQAEAARRNKLAESTGQPAPEGQRAKVKTNIFGAITILFLPHVVIACGITFTNL